MNPLSLPYPEIRRRLALLTGSERARWLTCLPLGLLTAVLETLGGVVVFALTASLVGVSARSSTLAALFTRTGLPDNPRILTLVAAGVYIVKNIVLLAALYYRTRIFSDVGAGLSRRATRAYLSAPYVFHLRRNSADSAQNVLAGVLSITRLLDALATLATELFVVAGLALLLMRVAFTETLLAAGIIIVVVGLFTRAARGRYEDFGARQHLLGISVLKLMQQALGGFKEVTVFGREPFFSAAISRADEERIRVSVTHAALESVPRLLTETAFILGMVGLLIALEARAGSPAGAVPFIGLYAYAGFRLIPAGHRLAYQTGNIHYEVAASAGLSDDLAWLAGALPSPSPAASGSGPLRFDRRLSVSNLTYRYEGAPRPVLDDISFDIAAGECIAIVGATGAGKTTLVDLLMGLLRPASGSITADGQSVDTALAAWRQLIGYVPQSPFLLDDTLRRNIAFGLADDDIDDEAVRLAADAAQLRPFIDTLPQGLDTEVGERGVRLSGGERQRVSVARALYRNPSLIVLDEATSSLDPGTERALTQAIDALKGRKTVIVIAHRLTTVERADRLLLLHGGRLAATGRYDELLASNQQFRELAAIDEV